ncbi:MAG: hypothetical protein P8176_05990 [Gammaproteobacteria bacterium]
MGSSIEAEKSIPILASTSKEMHHTVQNTGALNFITTRRDILSEQPPETSQPKTEQLNFCKRFRRYAKHVDPLVVNVAEKKLLAWINAQAIPPELVYSAYFIRHPSPKVVAAVAANFEDFMEHVSVSPELKNTISRNIYRIHKSNKTGGAFQNPEHRWRITEAMLRAYLMHPEIEIEKFRQNREAYVRTHNIWI